jgi:hypothetical protein
MFSNLFKVGWQIFKWVSGSKTFLFLFLSISLLMVPDKGSQNNVDPDGNIGHYSLLSSFIILYSKILMKYRYSTIVNTD